MINLNYLYNPDAAKPHFEKNYLLDKKLGFSVIEHGTILPYKKTIDGKTTPDSWGYGGIVDSKGKFITSSHVQQGIGSFYIPPQESVNHSSETVIYLGMFHSTWGHAITDNICRLWFLKSNEFKKQFKNCPLVYLLCTKREMFTLNSYKNFRRLLKLLEVEVDTLRLIEEPTQFDKIILPDRAFHLYGMINFTNEYRETIDCIKRFALKNRTPIAEKKIYYFHGVRQTGEERLAEYFKSKGYTIISPEKLTLDEQLNWLINCESFASTMGSCAHNSVFLRDGRETIFIPRGADSFRNIFQRTLNQIYSLNANYVDSTLTLFSRWYTDILYIISPQLKRFFGDKWRGYDEEDLKNFLQYVKNHMMNGHVIDPSIKEYYEPILSNFMAQLKRREDLITIANMPPLWETFRPLLTYQTHISKKGWSTCRSENQISNSLKQQFDIQAIKINYPDHKIYYSVYYNEDEGWTEEVVSPKVSGTTGKSKSIYGIKIHLDEADAKELDILYRIHKFDGKWTPWAKNGEPLYSQGVKLNAIQIKLEPVKTKSDAADVNKFDDTQTLWNKKANTLYTHRQDITQIKL